MAVTILALAVASCSSVGLFEPQTQTAPDPRRVSNTTGPLGVSDEEIEPDILAAAHDAAVSSSNYMIRVRQRVVGLGGDRLHEMK